ncbi:MAG: hypothetical protein ACPGN4_00345 [Miltoncostaeaceae bacterium]
MGTRLSRTGWPRRAAIPTGSPALLHRLALVASAAIVTAAIPASGALAAMPISMPSAPSAQPAAGGATAPAPTAYRGGGARVLASAYDAASQGNACPGFRRTRRTTLSVATNLVPCGSRVRICVGGKCVVAHKRDTGPFVKGRKFDLNVGVVRALGYRSVYAWGVRHVKWERMPGKVRTIATKRGRR